MNDLTVALLKAQVDIMRAANNLDNAFVVDLVDGICISDVEYCLYELKAAIYELEQQMSRPKKMKEEKCIECGAPAVWFRNTQFCGTHPYCEECAKKESDFNTSDPSYYLWSNNLSE